MTAPVRLRTDVLVLGSGGAGLFAALHAFDADPRLDITVAVKGLLGKCGCTRMVQGGYNAALAEGDSVEQHFMDTLRGGGWLNDQELAWLLVNGAVERIHELENRFGCFFDRNADGSVHQKAFAGQSFDRTVHKGDLTGIEIMNRLAEQVWARPIRRLEDHRAVALVPSRDGERVAGALLIDMRSGEFCLVQAQAVLLAAGGGPTMYRYHTPSGDKSCDGMAMALRAGLTLRDMEMVQFHPTGLLAGGHTRITGTIIEEGLRGAGGHLLDGDGRRFLEAYDERAERATRDIVSRAMFEQMRDGRTGPNGGVFLSMRHLDPERVRREFKGMVERCADVGFDLVAGLVEVTPTAHYMMGGVEFGTDGSTALPGLYAAGEDTGGVHGANRLGGNGVANSTVFGALAGDHIGRATGGHGAFAEPDATVVDAAVARCLAPFERPAGDLPALRERLWSVMWDDAGIVRSAPGLARADTALGALADELNTAGVPKQGRAFNLAWHDWLNLESQILVARAITRAALAREDSRGAHYREEHPHSGPLAASRYTRVSLRDDELCVSSRPVRFTRAHPDEDGLPPAGGPPADAGAAPRPRGTRATRAAEE